MTYETEQQDHTVLTMEALDDEIWHAVYLPLPDAPTKELIEEAHFAVQHCYQGARMRLEDPNMRFPNIGEPGISLYVSKSNVSQHAEAALERLLELEKH